MADKFTLTARWVFPVSAPPLERGVVTVAGDRIASVGPHRSRAADLDFGDAAVVPGFVNAHTHLDLTGARGRTPPTPDFTDWLRRVVAFRRRRATDQVSADVRTGIAECLAGGTTLIGDIAAEGGTWDALEAAPLRSVVFRELLGLAMESSAVAWEGFRWWRAAHEPTANCRPGVSPHAPYSVRASLYVQAMTAGIPLAIHLAETRAELDLLGKRSGPLVPFLKELSAWSPDGLADHLDFFLDHSCCDAPVLFIHGNYLHGVVQLPRNSAVVFCPRTHAAFGHPPHPFRDLLARGIRVALGTDSLASNPDLSLLAEARFVAARYPDFERPTLLRMATLSGAEALGLDDETGSLEPGKSADFAVVPLPDRDAADPHDLLFDSDLPVRATWFRGWPVFGT